MIKWNKRLALGLVAAPVMILGAAALPALAAGTASAPAAATQSDAYGPGYGYGMGPGMMGGYGPGYAGGAWQRGAVGPHARGWARGGYGSYGGYGPGMMGGYGGFGPGMMEGYGGFGPGMMAGYGRYGGFGPGMMGGFGAYGGWGVNPKLTDAQRTKVVSIEKALFDKQWPLMQSMQKVMFEAWGQAAGDKFDVDAIMKRATALSDLRLQMLRNRLEAVRQMDAVLTPQQRESLGEAR
ncbi:Spy/CpxP family protein refolding chaperone [Thiomonas sp.]|jgi:Spy/CpxP family protein refolding chaperone|uniref:Spy/CpxP family protein refolding chaperone n=1 Tax=Thiomonas sp. TaxID=2047785 RepID=UPI0026272FB1|nr:Spy/CpxP family protein refolding chaperone [Thiomonas sp.]